MKNRKVEVLTQNKAPAKNLKKYLEEGNGSHSPPHSQPVLVKLAMHSYSARLVNNMSISRKKIFFNE
jgi:hypothetical protein